MSEAKHTPGRLEIVGATHLVIFGEKGGNICTACSPRKRTVAEYTPSKKDDRDFDEACANAQYIRRAWNTHALLLEACKAYLYGRADDRECERMMRDAIAAAEEGGR